MRKFFFLITLFVTLLKANGQNIDYPVNNRVIINYDNYIVYAHFDTDEHKIKIDNNKYYYWFSLNDIKRTRGGFDGKILHGVYTEFYTNKNLKEKGQFVLGLKKGEWKSWYFNGELKERIVYKKGSKHGSYALYYPNKHKKEEGHYLNETWHGKIRFYDTTGRLMKTDTYKKGELVKEKASHRERKILKLFKRSHSKDTSATSSKKKKDKKSSDVQKAPEPKQEKQNKKSKADKKKEPVIRIRKSKKIHPGDPDNSSI